MANANRMYCICSIYVCIRSLTIMIETSKSNGGLICFLCTYVCKKLNPFFPFGCVGIPPLFLVTPITSCSIHFHFIFIAMVFVYTVFTFIRLSQYPISYSNRHSYDRSMALFAVAHAFLLMMEKSLPVR